MEEYIAHLREKIGHDQLLLVGVAGILVNEKDEILLQKRSNNGNWGVPGGILEPSETVLEGLQREVKEETNLDIQQPLLFGIYSGLSEHVTYPNGDQCVFVRLVFIVKSYDGILLTNEESIEMKFFGLDALPQQSSAMYIRTFDDYRAYKNGEINIPIVS